MKTSGADCGRMRTAKAFGIAPCTVSRIIQCVTTAISTSLCHKYINPPTKEGELKKWLRILSRYMDSTVHWCHRWNSHPNKKTMCGCKLPGSVDDSLYFANSNINQLLNSIPQRLLLRGRTLSLFVSLGTLHIRYYLSWWKSSQKVAVHQKSSFLAIDIISSNVHLVASRHDAYIERQWI